MDIQQQQKQSSQVMSLDKDGTHLHCKGRPVALPVGDAKSESLSTHHLPKAGDTPVTTAAGQKDAIEDGF